MAGAQVEAASGRGRLVLHDLAVADLDDAGGHPGVEKQPCKQGHNFYSLTLRGSQFHIFDNRDQRGPRLKARFANIRA